MTDAATVDDKTVSGLAGVRAPYWACFAVLAVAIAANAATHNRVWLVYSLVGVGIVLGVLLLDRRYRWHLPSRLLWWCGLPLSMHYLGGSLSGLHAWGSNGLYYALPWWDNLVHLLACGAVGVAAAYLLAPRLPRQPRTVVVLATCVSASLGILVELYEFVGFLWFGTVDQGYYTNTVLDLYYNALGAFLGAWLWMRPALGRRPAVRSAPAP